MLEPLTTSAARQRLASNVGADAEQLLVASLADLARQLVYGSARSGLGVSRRRVLFYLGASCKLMGELLHETPPLTSVEALDRLISIGDIVQSRQTLFAAPLRIVAVPGSEFGVLLGTTPSAAILAEHGITVKAAGVGRTMSASAADVLQAPCISAESWLAQPEGETWTSTLAQLEAELPHRAEPTVLEPEGIEMLARAAASGRCLWVPLDTPHRGFHPVVSHRGNSLIRLVLGQRVLGYVLVVGDPRAILEGCVRAMRLALDVGKRFHLALRAQQSADRVVHWTALASGLRALRVSWREVPSPEATVRALGTKVAINDQRQATAFPAEVAPLIVYLFERLGFRMEASDAT